MTPLVIAAEHYLTALRQRGRSKATIRNYGVALSKLNAHLQDQPPSPIELARWGAQLHDDYKPATVRMYTVAVKCFFTWAHQQNYYPTNPGSALTLPRVPLEIRSSLSFPQVQRLLAACNLDTMSGTRNHALITLALETGLRNAELRGLLVPDLDLSQRSLAVRIKGGQKAPAYFSHTTALRLSTWLAIRPNVPGVATVFVAVGGSAPGQPLTARGLNAALTKLGTEAGLTNLHAHTLRRTFARLLKERGAPKWLIKDLGRWNDERMVDYYTTGFDAQNIAQRYLIFNGHNDPIITQLADHAEQ